MHTNPVAGTAATIVFVQWCGRRTCIKMMLSIRISGGGVQDAGAVGHGTPVGHEGYSKLTYFFGRVAAPRRMLGDASGHGTEACSQGKPFWLALSGAKRAPCARARDGQPPQAPRRPGAPHGHRRACQRLCELCRAYAETDAERGAVHRVCACGGHGGGGGRGASERRRALRQMRPPVGLPLPEAGVRGVHRPEVQDPHV